MRFPAALAVAALVSACSINLTLPEGLVDAAKQAAADGRVVAQTGSLQEPIQVPAFSPTPPATPAPVPAGAAPSFEPTPPPTPEPSPTIDCEAIQAELAAEERALINSSWVQGAMKAGQALNLKPHYDAIYAKFYAKYPEAECIRTPAPEQPAP